MNALLAHPDCPANASISIAARAERSGASLLSLVFQITGDIRSLRIDPIKTPQRADNLWRSTCFEAFVKAPDSNAYYEFNFTPSQLWAAYRFHDYRAGMSAVHHIGAPDLNIKEGAEGFQFGVVLSLAEIAELTDSAPWAVGLSAVIEDREGGQSFWALKHPPGKPDFHHSDCFVLQMPPALRS